jgi:hypothetical protein
MTKSQHQIIMDQQNKIFKSLKQNKESWQDLFSFLMQYKKQIKPLSSFKAKD